MGSIDIIKLLFTFLGSAVNKSQQHQENSFGNAENWTAGCWVRSKCATSVLWRSPPPPSSWSNFHSLHQVGAPEKTAWTINDRGNKVWFTYEETPSLFPVKETRFYKPSLHKKDFLGKKKNEDEWNPRPRTSFKTGSSFNPVARIINIRNGWINGHCWV